MSDKLRRQQQALIQHEKMAVAGRMAAGVAHEIANPLASMDGLLQLIERRPDKPRPEAIATLREQVARISQIVRRMTAFAHPGDGEWQVRGLAEVAERALEVLRFDPRLKRVHVECQFDPDAPPVRILPEAIQQVIINLVVNAVDAMEQSAQPRLGVRTFRSGDWCAVEISDNGHGIPEEHRKRLFEPFFTTKPVGKGTGLGLSITYSLVQAHGGDLDLDSVVGEGARFTVRLPVTPEGAPASVAADAGDNAGVRSRAPSPATPIAEPPVPVPRA
jgi:signal transduction histidine kinase